MVNNIMGLLSTQIINYNFICVLRKIQKIIENFNVINGGGHLAHDTLGYLPTIYFKNILYGTWYFKVGSVPSAKTQNNAVMPTYPPDEMKPWYVQRINNKSFIFYIKKLCKKEN